MIEFKKPDITDLDWVKKAMAESEEISCEYCFGNLYIWSQVYNTMITEYDGMFLAKSESPKGVSFLYPCGKGNKKAAIEELIEISRLEGKKLSMYSLSEKSVKELNELFPDRFEIIPTRSFFDYIYTSEDLCELKGRKYHAKRNHISYFKNNFNWSYERITPDNIKDCIEMNKKWEALNDDSVGLDNELDAINRAFDKYFELGFTGGLIRRDGEVVAYTFGEPITNEVFCTHVEKAFSDVRGAYPIINQQFCENELMSYKYVNREDDTGDDGLRQAKLSYNPTILLEKFDAVLKE